jgi:hypothetical protein
MRYDTEVAQSLVPTPIGGSILAELSDYLRRLLP